MLADYYDQENPLTCLVILFLLITGVVIRNTIMYLYMKNTNARIHFAKYYGTIGVGGKNTSRAKAYIMCQTHL